MQSAAPTTSVVVQAKTLAPDDFFALFDKHNSFDASRPLEDALRGYTPAELTTKMDPRIRQLVISYMSSRCAQVYFEEKYVPADNDGFTVREVITFIVKYYTEPFTPEQIASIRQRVNSEELDHDLFYDIARRPPRPLTFSDVNCELKEEHVDNYLKFYNLSLDGCFSSRLIRMTDHYFQQKLVSDQAEYALATQHPDPPHVDVRASWSEPEIVAACKALGVYSYHPFHDALKLFEMQQAGTVLPELPAAPTDLRDTCPRWELLRSTRFDGFIIGEISETCARVSIDIN
jgi:hypothetical protein